MKIHPFSVFGYHCFWFVLFNQVILISQKHASLLVTSIRHVYIPYVKQKTCLQTDSFLMSGRFQNGFKKIRMIQYTVNNTKKSIFQFEHICWFIAQLIRHNVNSLSHLYFKWLWIKASAKWIKVNVIFSNTVSSCVWGIWIKLLLSFIYLQCCQSSCHITLHIKHTHTTQTDSSL